MNSTCEIRGTISENRHACTCNVRGYNNSNGICAPPNTRIPTPSTPPTSGVGSGTTQLHLSYIIAIAATGLILLVIVLVIVLVLSRCQYVRCKRRGEVEFTPSSSSNRTTQLEQHQQSNGITKAESVTLTDLEAACATRRTNDYVTHTITDQIPTFKPLVNGDIRGSLSPAFARPRSASQETGFHTASEQEDSRRNSHRSEQIDSDFSTCDTDSEDYTGTSGIEEVMSPHEMHLVSSGSMMGVPNHFRRKHPLSPRERNILTPLRPNSDLLSETDTEVSTTTTTNPGRAYTDNDTNLSDPNAPKWYKTSSPSTIVDEDSNTPHSLQAAVLHKQHRSKKKHSLSHFRQFKSSSPLHTQYIHHHQPLSSSPLVRSQRFNFPAVSPLEPPNRAAITENTPTHYVYHQYPPIHPASHHTRQYSEHSYTDPAAPIHIRGISDTPYYPGYQGTNLTPATHETPLYRDLNSLAAQVNPITYWEQQRLLRPAVDQDDPLQLLSGPCVPFEDVSTEPSVIESSVVGGEDNHSTIYMPSAQEPSDLPTRLAMSRKGWLAPRGPNGTTPATAAEFRMVDYQNFASQGEEEGTAETNLSSNVEYTPSTQSQHRPLLTRVNITHFPAAECTPSYNNSSNTLDTNTPDSPFHITSSQVPLCT